MHRRSGPNLIALFQQLSSARGLCVGVAVIGVAMHGAERLAGGNSVADLFMNFDTDSRIDRIFLAFAASAEDDASGANLFAQDARHISALWTRHIDTVISIRRRVGSSIVLMSPPCSSTIWRNLSKAWPEAMIRSESCLPCATVLDAPPR